MLIFGGPIWSWLAQLSRQQSLNVDAPTLGQSGLSLLLSQVGSGSIPGCPGACMVGGKQGVEA